MSAQEHSEHGDVPDTPSDASSARRWETVGICAACAVGIAAWTVAVYEGVRVVF